MCFSDYSIVIDWLTFSAHFNSFDEMIDFLHLDELREYFEPCAPRWFYNAAYTYKNEITLFLGQRSDHTMCCFNISGKGCRDIERFSGIDLDYLLKYVNSADGFQLSRCDIAMDIIDNSFCIDDLINDTKAGNFTCRSKFYNIMESYDDGIIGKSLYFGRKCSNIFINIYDKRAEQKHKPDEMDNWTRIEIRLRHEDAVGFAKRYSEGMDVGYLFVGILNNYLKFLKPSDSDSNKSRWELTDYWEMVISHSNKVKIFSKLDVEYDILRFERYLYKQCGSAIATALTLYSPIELKNQIELRNIKPNKKQQFLIDNYTEGIDFKLM